MAPPGLDRETARKLLWNARQVARVANGRAVRLHCRAAYPEGIIALAYRALTMKNVPIVLYAHGEELLIARTSRLLEAATRSALSHASLVVANSDNTRRLVQSMSPKARSITIHPGVDAETFLVPSHEVAAYRSAKRWSQETIVVGTIGRLEPRKNHRAVIDALAHLSNQGHRLVYAFAGSGETEGALREHVARCGYESWVIFLGPIDDREKPVFLASLDIFAMPSIQLGPMIEGFGMVFLEAAAAGVPTVAGNIGGQSEAIIDTQTGFVVDGTNGDALVNVMGRLCSDRELRTALGQSGRAWAKHNSWEQAAKSLQDVLP